MSGSPIAAIVRGWVGLYTRGMPAELRAGRRDEIDDDLWCQHEEAAALGRPAWSLGTDLFLRLVFGMPADLSWRLAYRGPSRTGWDSNSSMDTRGLGVCAIVAGLDFGILGILYIIFGEAVWVGDNGVVGVIMSLVGASAFMAVGLGLSWRFEDRIGSIGSIGALVLTLGATMSLFGVIVPLLAGSAMLMWDLARIGVVPRLVPIIHIAAAAVFTIGLVVPLGIVESASGAVFASLFAAFLLTWVRTGVSLFRGVPQVQVTGG